MTMPRFPAERVHPRLPSLINSNPGTRFPLARDAKGQRPERTAFLQNFLRQPPQERIRLWNQRVELGSLNMEMERLLIAHGLDTAPYLGKIVRAGKSEDRLYALKLLCDMDRFVAAEQLLLPELGGSIFGEVMFTRGLSNNFMIVDGRRIGAEGYSAVRWATEQTQDQDLRFHARQYSGLLIQDLRQLPLAEQFSRWRAAVIKSKGLLGADSDAQILMFHLGNLLVERAPDSMALLANTLDHDANGYVREQAIHILQLVDEYRMRLRTTEGGRMAVAAVQRALGRGGLKPVYTKRSERENYWKIISAEVFDDNLPLHDQSDWALYALALERFYGVKATNERYTTPEIRLVEAKPELRKFITFLTAKDPFFPSWEYTDAGWGWGEVLHPRFKQKVARLYEEWRKFDSSGSGTALH